MERFAGTSLRALSCLLLSARQREFAGGRERLVVEILTWVIQQRVVLADRIEQLRKEITAIEAEVARLEAAEVVIGSSSRLNARARPTIRPWTRSWSGSPRRPGRAGCG
ncbi:hypothetical protein SAZ_33195 [Streptomyces noursei ZPM]|uniref:Uncharacterized protein n=1 Tax=Streptomyces noursei TaxID=1971 RepID=A0A401RA98_STRNR|nr:hypothetical protein SAZ_33195 [Streptomyces noursei ZPM]EOT04732.1 hypothetical protein K530_06857 [Streptomyces noursei CCRC 11814]EXU92690.1 hypothetical protein P354_15760 [Streptomyces noursei PD-1]GCB94544.1 hypothetical protein SALB_07344 [Streptomyces noursei]